MALRARILSLVEVVLRVPPLFIMDELLKIGMGLDGSSTNGTTTTINGTMTTDGLANATVAGFIGPTLPPTPLVDPGLDASFYKLLLITIIKFIFSCAGIAVSLCVFMLCTRHLAIVYMYFITVGIVFISYWTNMSTLKAVATAAQPSILEDILALNINRLLYESPHASIVIQNYALQFLLAYLFTFAHLGPRHGIIQKLLPISFVAPSLLALLPLPAVVLHHAPVFAALLPLALVKFVIWCSALSVVRTIYSGYQHARSYVSNFGLSALVEAEWTRLNVPTVLRTFWLLRVLEQLGVLLVDRYGEEELSPLSVAKSLLVSGCETLTAVLGMTSVVSHLCHYVGCFFQWILLTEDDEDKSIGTVSAILFYILALQTGLTGLEPEKRFVRLCRNFCLLFTALLHFIHNIVNPLLMSLSASHNPSLRRHLRALAVCAFLVLFPVTLLAHLWTNHMASTWLLAVSAFSVEVIVKVIVSLAIYGLFLLDAYRSTFWEKLDDYVYYIRAFGNTIEFCFGIFLFFNGAWILFFESGGAIRAIMMCIHAYFNIWCEARSGWSVFIKRRTAVNKINSLPEADDEQLLSLDDVCAICYQDMKSAKITRCNHFFHGVCLRKWLYVQDRCPLCHEILYKMDISESSTPNAGEQVPIMAVAVAPEQQHHVFEEEDLEDEDTN